MPSKGKGNVAAPAAGVEYPLSLGRTLQSDQHHEQYVTLRYDWKPASLAKEGEGELEVHPGSHTAVVRLPSSAAGAPPATFNGKHEPSKDALDCVAIFDGTGFRLEVVGAAAKNLKHAPGATRAAAPAPAAKQQAPAASRAAAAAAPAPAPALEFMDSLMLEEEIFRELAGGAEPMEAEAAPAAPAQPAGAAPSGQAAQPGAGGAAGAAREAAAAAAAPAAAAPVAAPQPPRQRPLMAKAKVPRPEEMSDLDREFFGALGAGDSPDHGQDSGSSSGSEEEEEEAAEEAASGKQGSEFI